jgi:PAS domain S-box-containing protein
MGKNSSGSRASSFFDKPSDYYLRLIENSKDNLYIINGKTGKIEYTSPAITVITGFTPKEIIEIGVEGLNKRMHPDDHRMIKKTKDILAHKTLPKDFNDYIELRFRHKAGHYIWLGVSRNFITDGSGGIEVLVGNMRDITETKLLQQQLESALYNYKTLYNNAQVALFRTRISDGKLLECSETLVKLLGYKSQQQCLDEHYSAKHYTDPKRRDELIKILKEKGQVDNFELQARRINGEIFWAKISAQVYPEKGYLEGAMWDITASKILTSAENKILELVMQGKSNKEIAFQLKRSIRTIEDHRAHIMQKLGANNLVELTRKAIDSGIAPEEK